MRWRSARRTSRPCGFHRKSIQEFLRAELERLAARPSIDAWLQEVRKRKRAQDADLAARFVRALDQVARRLDEGFDWLRALREKCLTSARGRHPTRRTLNQPLSDPSFKFLEAPADRVRRKPKASRRCRETTGPDHLHE
jgi:aryl carrier-like protein